MNGWAWVLLGGLLEIGFTTALKLEQQDPRWFLVFLACAIASFECLARALATIPLGLAYAIWTGIGAVGTFAVGLLAFGEPGGAVRILVVLALVATLAGLKMVSDDPSATGARPAPHRPSR